MDNQNQDQTTDQISQIPNAATPETIQTLKSSAQIENIIANYIKYPEERKAQHIKWLLKGCNGQES